MENKTNTLAVHVSNRCQNRCIFCMERDSMGARNTNFDETVKGFENQIKSALKIIPNLDRVYIAGGEPTLNTNISNLVKIVKSNGLRCDLVTNGGNFIHKSFLFKLKDSGLDSVHLSIHSADKEIHDTLTGREGSFDRALKIGTMILDQGIKLYINVVVNRLNIDNLAESAIEYTRLLPGHYMQSYYLMRPVGAADLSMAVGLEKAGNELEKTAELIKALSSNEESVPLITARDIPHCLLGKQHEIARIQDFYFRTGPDEFMKIGKRRYKKKWACILCSHKKTCPGYLKKYL